MTIPTEPIGSIPRPPELIQAVVLKGGNVTDPALESSFDEALRDTALRFEDTDSPVITDGEQRKYHNFWDYCVHGLSNMTPEGFKIPFGVGHTRRMPRFTHAPFRYKMGADEYLDVAQRYATRPVKQAVISPSALSLLYPVRDHMQPGQRIFVGEVSPIDPQIESAEEVRDRVLEAAEYLPLAQLGTTDDCGFSPFSDDVSTTRDTAFAKIRARVCGTKMAAKLLGLHS